MNNTIYQNKSDKELRLEELLRLRAEFYDEYLRIKNAKIDEKFKLNLGSCKEILRDFSALLRKMDLKI